ncbi:hypothetical protein [Dyadobacter sp. CY312]|uniref:hypothetical protein n=1 Tax=Dyadobacter sp. CY312 TaxID=2907303 RepID=UPI001F30A332|nr:hypothetical protein [Dyadobacter sp. CY312]MCE7040195.1 hypothetical protein [Dyadobacter sp. CY312]
MKKILFVAAILVLGFTSANAQYGPRDDRDRYNDREYGYQDRDNNGGRNSEVNYMQREAREKISAGIRTRRLSRREANVLMNEYQRIEAKERAFSRRGRLSARETRIIRDDLRRLMADTHRLSRRDDGWARDDRY